ncbi:MAG: RlmE family RNA methyltransferase [Candidatus Dadabacteria bacterium]|nr:MAG: RlmE family RNA methyltransferase [Candidatus Dadabacteria bacterium]
MARYRPQDSAYRDARNRGYRSRAAIKLEELDRRFRLFRPGQRVVDLGCWPGGWLQVAAQRVGRTGKVVGVDVRKVEPLGLPNVLLIEGDVRREDVRRAIRRALGGPADVVLADLAPKLTGIQVTDAQRQLELVEAAIAAGLEVLKTGGCLLVKLFSPVEAEAVALLERCFTRVEATRPPSTRKGSAEIYALARGLRRDRGRPE